MTDDLLPLLVRAGCNDADIHLRCSYPECGCVVPPAIVRGVLQAIEAAGLVIVPREPTDDMRRDGQRTQSSTDFARGISPTPEGIWQAMIAAALRPEDRGQ